MPKKTKNTTHVCATCVNSTITPVEIALLKLNGEHFSYTCKIKNSTFRSTFARFNRKNCGLYKGPGSGTQFKTESDT